MITWEYHIEDMNEHRLSAAAFAKPENRAESEARTVERKLVALGAEGWELVTATFIENGRESFWKMIFKRPKGGILAAIPAS